MSKKIIGIIISCLVLFSVFFIPELSFADENLIDGISSMEPVNLDIFDFGSSLIKSVAAIIATIAFTLMAFGAEILNFVIGGSYLEMGSSVIDADLITYGWEVVRDIANIVVALAFVVVGLGIILGLDNFQAKKSLPTLIIIALLINFTPAICWFIIDIVNVVIGTFLTTGINLSALDMEYAIEQMGSIDNAMSALVWAIILMIFAVASALIMVLYAMLFLARYFALWVLIIVSPIAFATKAIPRNLVTDKLFPGILGWTEWWSRFIEWNAIGVVGGFFLYLGVMLVSGMAEALEFDFLSFGTYMQMALPFIFLYIGFFTTLESSSFGGASGTMQKIRGSKTYTKVAGGVKGAAGKGAGFAKAGAKRGTGRISEATGAGKFTASARKSWHNATEKVTGDYGAYDAAQSARLSERQKAYSGRSNDNLNKAWSRKSLGVEERVALANELISRKEIDQAKNPDIFNEMASLQKHGLNTKELLKFRPDVATQFGKKSVTDVVSNMNASDVANMSADALKDIKVASSLNAYQGAAIYKNGNEDQRKNISDTLGRGLDKEIKEKLDMQKKTVAELNSLGTSKQKIGDEIKELAKQRDENREKLKDIVDQVSKK
jgi:hypothetical protein